MNKIIPGAALVLAVLAFGLGVFKTAPNTDSGAVSSLNNVDSPYVSIGGVEEWRYSLPLLATSTALCTVANPYTSTSTLVAFSMNITSNPLGSISFDLSTSSQNVGNSTSSPAYIWAQSLGSGQATVAWSPAATSSATLIGNPINAQLSGGVLTPGNIIRAGEYLTVRIATGTPATYGTYASGRCNFIVRKL